MKQIIKSDNDILIGVTIDAINLDTLLSYRKAFRLERKNHVWNEVDDKTFMTKMGCYAVDNRTKEGGVTVAGLLMFGKVDILYNCLDGFELVFKDNTVDGAQAEKNLYNFYDFMSAHQGALYCYSSLMEALINMFAHVDIYKEKFFIHVTKDWEGYTFQNSGCLSIELEDYLEGGISCPRNERILSLFRMLRKCDGIGAGYAKMVHLWDKEISVTNDKENNTFTIHIPNE